jgi:hypothetical protein
MDALAEEGNVRVLRFPRHLSQRHRPGLRGALRVSHMTKRKPAPAQPAPLTEVFVARQMDGDKIRIDPNGARANVALLMAGLDGWLERYQVVRTGAVRMKDGHPVKYG